MKWSFSAARTFDRCQRQWFYKTVVAQRRSSDPVRREAYVLSKLQSIAGWRGSLVDRVIGHQLVEAIRQGRSISKRELRAAARTRFDNELASARRHAIRDPSSDPTSTVGFRAVEYNEQVTDEELRAAWMDVETALDNLFAAYRVRTSLKAALHIVTQRPLVFGLHDFKVVAVPDVIAFFQDAPPLIVDWKVQTFGTLDYRLQLALYALALVRCPPHRDFPTSLQATAPTDVRIIEVQLLTGAEREYRLEPDDFDALDDYIVASASEMAAALGRAASGDQSPYDYSVTAWPETCGRCVFKRLCWGDDQWPALRRTSTRSRTLETSQRDIGLSMS